MTGWYVTANDIRNWTETNKRRAEELLPLLVKKLILASCQPKNIDFPSGDNIAVGGWDGILDVKEGNGFVPAGKSGWEFGTNSNVKSKADSDYTKRTKDPAPLRLQESTFVFVTSRLWTKRDGWARAKESTGKWKNVQGLNAESLSDWLETCPAVHRWFSEKLGKRFPKIWDINQAWDEYTNKTAVKLSPDFLIYRRQGEAKLLVDLIFNEPKVHRVKAHSKIEAYGFILATLISNEKACARCLIIKSQESWDSISGSEQSLVLIPYGFQPTGMGTAVSNKHSVIIAVDDKDNQSESIRLRSHPKLIREESFKELGFNEDESSTLFQDTKGYIEPLLRHNLLKPIDYIAPEWPSTFPSDTIFAVFFANSWNESNAHDRELLETLSGLPYSEFQSLIIELSKVDDAPIRQIGDIWQVISKMDFWLLVASKIAKPHISRLGSIVLEIYSDMDPSYDLPSSERYMASVKGATPKYSNLVKQGIAGSLAMLSVYGDEYSSHLGGEPISSDIAYWIRCVFETHNNAKFWYSLGGSTRLLAEASPEEFINAIESATSGDAPCIAELFESEGNAFLGGCHHSDLLWALEIISWNKRHLTKVSLCLARLSEIDHGGSWSNRPFNSLVDMFLGWINNTSATHQERLTILEEVLIRQHPEIAWKLMVALLIGNSETTSGLCKPEYRDWSNDTDRNTTQQQYFDYVTSIVDLLLRELDSSLTERVTDLIDNLDSFSQQQQDAILERLLVIDGEEIEAERRKKILNKLRSTLARHREFSTSDWAWPESLLLKLEKVYLNLDFKDVVTSNTFLFDDVWPDLIDPIQRREHEYEELDKILNAKRVSALESVYSALGKMGLEKLVIESGMPRLVGQTAYNSSLSKTLQPTAIDWLDENNSRADFSKGYICSLAFRNEDHAEELFLQNSEQPNAFKAKFLHCFPLNSRTLNLIETIPTAAQSFFWTNLSNSYVSEKNSSTVSRVAESLLNNNRPIAAIDAIAQLLYGKNALSELDGKLISDILIRIATDPSDAERISISNVRYDILRSIEFIQEAGQISESEICQIEWAYLKILRAESFSPKYLIQTITEDPGFFSQLVVWTFKRRDNEEDPKEDLPDSLLKQRAEIAWELLEAVSVLPGTKGNQIHVDTLSEWITEVRNTLLKAGRQEIGDDRIGKLLSCCPKGDDGIWPHEAVRTVLEQFKSKEIEQAIIVGRRNSRGVTSRHPYAGGEQERVLAQGYYEDAQAIQLVYPRTSDILITIAKRYERDADQEDREVELRD